MSIFKKTLFLTILRDEERGGFWMGERWDTDPKSNIRTGFYFYLKSAQNLLSNDMVHYFYHNGHKREVLR